MTMTMFSGEIIKKTVSNYTNNSVSGYKHIRTGTIWITDIYQTICKYLTLDENINLWDIHKRYLQYIKPKVCKNKNINPSYVRWFLYQVPIHIHVHYLIRTNKQNINLYIPMGIIKEFTGDEASHVREMPYYLNVID